MGDFLPKCNEINDKCGNFGLSFVYEIYYSDVI